MIPMPLIWTEFSDHPMALERLVKVLDSWEGTPWEGCRRPGPRPPLSSCLEFLCGVMEDLLRVIDPIDYPRLPNDVGMNNPKVAKKALNGFMADQFPSHECVNSIRVQPGDVLAVGQGGPGHAMIVGPRRNTLWHVTKGRCVHYTGWVLPPQSQLFSIYRLTDRDLWA